MKTIEELQKIVADEARSTEERKQAAELILKMQGIESTHASTPDDAKPSGLFDAIILDDGDQGRQQAEDEAQHVCAECYLLQEKAHEACTLCDATAWLVPSDVRKNDEQAMFLKMAATYTISDLTMALRSGWASWNKTGERERVARLLLTLRHAQMAPKQKEQIAVEPPAGQKITKEQVSSAMKYLDLQSQKIQAEIDALRKQSGGRTLL